MGATIGQPNLKTLPKTYQGGGPEDFSLVSADYGLFAQRHVESFDQKWVRGSFPRAELLGTGDIQSVGDLGNSHDIVREMRVDLFGLQDVTRLALATAAPLSPLLLTVFSVEELISRVIIVVF